jgi:hypothetical protein
MLPALDEWYTRQSERVLSRQTTQVETVKLVVTFSLAIAATLVATALQVEPVTGADLASCTLLAVSFFYTVWTIGLDNLQEPDPTRAEALRVQHSLTEDQFLARVRASWSRCWPRNSPSDRKPGRRGRLN